MNIHKCPAIGCKAVIPAKLLMCSRHWHMLPKGLQDAVWRTWRAKNRPAHLAAAKAAVQFVRQAENTPTPQS